MSNLIPLVIIDDQPRIDSRVIAEQLGVEHKNTRELIYKFQADFQEFGLLPFETEAVKTEGERGTKHHKFALLNEDQAYLLLTYSQNTTQARDLKKRLVHAFSHYRRLATNPPISVQPQHEPIPTLTCAQWQVIESLIHDISYCCQYKDKAQFGARERIRFGFGLRSVRELHPADFDAAVTDLKGIHELADQHRIRMAILDEEFITAVIRPPVSIRKVRAMAKKHAPQPPLVF